MPDIARLQGTFEPDPKFKIAYDIWTDYYDATERYDRHVCAYRSSRNGHAIPVGPDEHRMCSRSAIAQLGIARHLLRYKEIPDNVAERAQAAALDAHEQKHYD